MLPTLDNALVDDLVHVLKRDDQAGRYTITIGELKTPVEIRLHPRPTSYWVDFETSHCIRTPGMRQPYRPSAKYGDGAAPALQRAISSIKTSYEEAVNEGFEPNEAWLVKNR